MKANELQQALTEEAIKAMTTPTRIDAGEVVFMKRESDNCPFEVAMALLLTPIIRKKGFYIGSFKTAYMTNIETGEYVEEDLKDVSSKIWRVPKGELKAAFFRNIEAHHDRERRMKGGKE